MFETTGSRPSFIWSQAPQSICLGLVSQIFLLSFSFCFLSAGDMTRGFGYTHKSKLTCTFIVQNKYYQTFSVKGQIVNILNFVGYVVFVNHSTLSLQHKASSILTNKHGCILIKMLFTKAGQEQDLAQGLLFVSPQASPTCHQLELGYLTLQ